MRKLLIAIVAVLPLTFGCAAASAHDFGEFPSPGMPVVGTIVSTDPTSGTFVANAFAPTGFGEDSSDFDQPPVTTQVTISTDSNTRLLVDEQPGTVADMSAGDRFIAFFTGSPGDSLQTLVSNPALAVFDHPAPKPHQLYAFVGSVTGVDTTAGALTVDVTRSLPADLVPAGSAPVSFTVGADTLVLGGSSTSLFGGSLANVSVGDIVAGGLIGDAGETLAQVEQTPLKLLLDLPAGSGQAGAKRTTLNKALSLLGGKPLAPAHKAHKSHRHARRHHKTHARRHARRS
jgi:hypothetical protein